MNQSLGHDAFLVDTEEQAQKIMEMKSSCRVWPCVFPSMCPTAYFISEHGELYGCRYHNQLHKFTGYSIKPIKERKYLAYDMNVRKGVHHRPIGAERLIYCTFVLGEWDDDIEIGFRDGDPYNMTLENLGEKKDPLTPEVADRMYDWTDKYKRWFTYVASVVRYACWLEMEDAIDIAQEAFIDLMIRYNWSKEGDFVGLWISRAKELGINQLKKQEKHLSLFTDGYDHNITLSVRTKGYEVDLLSPIVGNSRKIVELKMQNVPEAEIAEELGIEVGSVGSMYYQAKKKLRKYWGKDPELAKIYLSPSMKQ